MPEMKPPSDNTTSMSFTIIFNSLFVVADTPPPTTILVKALVFILFANRLPTKGILRIPFFNILITVDIFFPNPLIRLNRGVFNLDLNTLLSKELAILFTGAKSNPKPIDEIIKSHTNETIHLGIVKYPVGSTYITGLPLQ